MKFGSIFSTLHCILGLICNCLCNKAYCLSHQSIKLTTLWRPKTTAPVKGSSKTYKKRIGIPYNFTCRDCNVIIGEVIKKRSRLNLSDRTSLLHMSPIERRLQLIPIHKKQLDVVRCISKIVPLHLNYHVFVNVVTRLKSSRQMVHINCHFQWSSKRHGRSLPRTWKLLKKKKGNTHLPLKIKITQYVFLFYFNICIIEQKLSLLTFEGKSVT